MRWLVTILEWLVLLPLWRSLFRPRPLQWVFAGATGFVLLIVVVAIAASVGGDEEEEAEPAAQTQPTAVAAAERTPTEEKETPKPPSPERIVAAVPGAVAEAEGVRITLNAIADPWVSDNMFIQPDAGRRLVAFDVTIEYMKTSGSHYATSFNFKLTDAENFAYEHHWFAGPEPDLQGIDLGGGQKTRGWVTFEVNEGTPLKLLKYDPAMFTTNDIEFQW